jgi:hypothetical protein
VRQTGLRTRFRNGHRARMGDRLGSKLGSELRSDLGNVLGTSLGDKLGSELAVELGSELAVKLAKNSEDGKNRGVANNRGFETSMSKTTVGTTKKQPQRRKQPRGHSSGRLSSVVPTESETTRVVCSSERRSHNCNDHTTPNKQANRDDDDNTSLTTKQVPVHRCEPKATSPLVGVPSPHVRCGVH